MSAITDYDIQALVDNELPRLKKREVLDIVNRDRKYRHRYRELLSQKELLKRWWSRTEELKG